MLRLSIALSCCLMAACSAASPPAPEGEQVARERCASCHGLNGQAVSRAIPSLGGQLSDFTALQLRNFRSGERPHAGMQAIAGQLSEVQILAVARHYAAQPGMTFTATVDPSRVELGRALFTEGKPGVPACRYCHGEQGRGVAPVFARIAGQSPEFIVAAMEPYRKVPRFGNPYAMVMKAVVQGLSDDEIQGVAAYAATLR